MLWRTYLLNRLVWSRDIRLLIWRHPIAYIKVLIQCIALFLLIFFVHRVVRFRVPVEIMQIVFASLVWLLYLIGIYMLLRSYFDVMVVTSTHLYIVLWDSFFKYSIKILSRSSIQDISVTPASGLSPILKDGHISFATEQDERIEFRHIYQPALVASKMYSIRDMQLVQEDADSVEEAYDETSEIDDDKFKVLVETLWEVIVDYMKKKE